MKDEDFLAEVREKFQRAVDSEDANRKEALDDHKFARLGEQWDGTVKRQREHDGRPCLVINHHPAFIRQVVNTARQNRPAINVVPADSNADKQTAEIMSGLIRNIEVSSDADIAYDTAVENAVAGGFGYFRINLAYTSDDSFDKDITIEAIPDAFTVYGDPDAESFDGSDWNCAFIVKRIPEDDYKRDYKNKAKSDFTDLKDTGAPWYDDETVTIAEYWTREEVGGQIVALSNDTVVKIEEYEERAEEYAMQGIEPIGQPRSVKTHKVTQYIVSGVEVLEKVEWPGKYIPIVAVYGEAMVIEGKRYFKSLIRDAKDPQREHNYWRSAAAESVALAPRIPFIGPEGAFDIDVEKWSTANHASHAFIQYAGGVPPQRQPYVGPPAGELSQSVMAADDMKTIIGLYNPSLGERGGSDSGIAIRSLQRQGDIGTFHFIDNLSRSIRHAGRILLDLIGKVYTTPRVLRVLGEDMQPQVVQAAPQDQQQDMLIKAQMRGQAIERIYDLTAGKYDLVVKAGPSFGTQREYAQAEIVEIIRAFPDSAPILGPMYLENSDWPGATEAAEQLKAMVGQPEQGNPEQAAQMQQAVAQMQQQMQQLAQENAELKQQAALKAEELRIKGFEAETKRFEVQAKAENDRFATEAGIVQSAAQAREQSNPYAMEGTQ